MQWVLPAAPKPEAAKATGEAARCKSAPVVSPWLAETAPDLSLEQHLQCSHLGSIQHACGMISGMDEFSGDIAPCFSQMEKLSHMTRLNTKPLCAGAVRAHSFRNMHSRLLPQDACSFEQSWKLPPASSGSRTWVSDEPRLLTWRSVASAWPGTSSQAAAPATRGGCEGSEGSFFPPMQCDGRYLMSLPHQAKPKNGNSF